MTDISHRKYNYIRAQQLKRQEDGVALMPFESTPSLPEWNDKLALPPSFEEYLLEKDKEDWSMAQESIEQNVPDTGLESIEPSTEPT